MQLYIGLKQVPLDDPILLLTFSPGAGEAGGQGGPWPPNKIFNDAFFCKL